MESSEFPNFRNFQNFQNFRTFGKTSIPISKLFQKFCIWHKIRIIFEVISEKFPNFENRTFPKLAKIKSWEIFVFRKTLPFRTLYHTCSTLFNLSNFLFFQFTFYSCWTLYTLSCTFSTFCIIFKFQNIFSTLEKFSKNSVFAFPNFYLNILLSFVSLHPYMIIH